MDLWPTFVIFATSVHTRTHAVAFVNFTLMPSVVLVVISTVSTGFYLSFFLVAGLVDSLIYHSSNALKEKIELGKVG